MEFGGEISSFLPELMSVSIGNGSLSVLRLRSLTQMACFVVLRGGFCHECHVWWPNARIAITYLSQPTSSFNVPSTPLTLENRDLGRYKAAAGVKWPESARTM
jgi:hypothetical protein